VPGEGACLQCRIKMRKVPLDVVYLWWCAHIVFVCVCVCVCVCVYVCVCVCHVRDSMCLW
jgi:hypothetical protein